MGKLVLKGGEGFDKLLFYIFVFFLPSQLGKHYWPSFSFIKGLKVDYYSPTVYFSEVLLWGVILFWFFRKRKKLGEELKRLFRERRLLIILTGGFLFGNILKAEVGEAAILKVGRLVEMGFIFWYGRKEIKRKDFKKLVVILGIGVILEAGICLGQIIKQASIGGVFWYLGERSFNLGTLGIAKAVVKGREILRGYGTFSHPNSLAGYLVLTLFLMMILYEKAESKGKRMAFFMRAVFFGGVLGVIMSYSKAGIMGGLVLTGIMAVKIKKGKRVVFLGIIFLVLGLRLWQGVERMVFFEKQSVKRRREMIKESVDIFLESPILGVGLNNYIYKGAEKGMETKKGTRIYQPEHNVYLLVLAETGVFGFFGFLLIIGYFLKEGIKEGGWFLGGIFFILTVSLFDHYFWTLIQNQYILALFLGEGASKFEKKEKR